MKSKNTPITAKAREQGTSDQPDKSQLTRTDEDQVCPIQEIGEQSVPNCTL